MREHPNRPGAIGQWHPTILQLLRGMLQLGLDAAAMAFSYRRTIRYRSSGRIFRGTIYYPPIDRPAPAVLILPTAFGLTPHEHATASRLARKGYLALVVAYSRRTTGAVLRDDQRRRQIEQIVLDAWHYLCADQRADQNRLAVIGFSLGGYFATHIGTADTGFLPRAIVVYYGMYKLPDWMVAGLNAPILILQGEKDSAEFVTNAREMQERALRHGKACELVLYPNAGHQFDLFDPGSEASRNAWMRSLAFLQEHLGASSL